LDQFRVKLKQRRCVRMACGQLMGPCDACLMRRHYPGVAC
jgi:hypothetical protein